MRKPLAVFLLVIVSICLYSQGMTVKQYNFTSFSTDRKFIPEILEQQSTAQSKQHPEYGILPYNAQCTNCVELVAKRTVDSRQFFNPYQPNHTYSQKSFFPMHYRESEKDIWRTIDFRLRPDEKNSGVYKAIHQPVPTICDLHRKTTSLFVNGFQFEFNHRLSMYFFDENDAYTKTEEGNYADYTIGEEGLHIKNIWQGIDLEEIFNVGEVEANYVISAPLDIPISKGWMVIEDHFTLPEGYSIHETKQGETIAGKYYRGDYIIRNKEGEDIITYGKPVYLDAKAYGEHGQYELLRAGNDYTLKMLIPVAWLKRKGQTYPLTIDPIVQGVNKLGDFRLVGPSAGMAFTTMALGSCDYFLTDTVPGMSRLTNAYVDLEYQLTYDNACGTPPLPPPFCTFSQVTMEVLCDTCHTSTGLLACNPALPPYTGTCTTDPNLVPGAGPLLINNFTPNYMSCLPPQCPDYVLDFTLKNRDSICGDVCGFLCARGNMWRMTIEACTVEGSISQDTSLVCAGEPVTFTAHPNCGVPPYHYYWTQDGGNTYDTIYGTPNYVIHPQANVTVGCYVADTCENLAQTNDLDVTVIASPPADAGPDHYLCEGGAVQIGGSPSSSGGANLQWTGENVTVQSWLSGGNISNPVAMVPPGTIDTFFYVLRASDFSCFRTDTVQIYSSANPIATIDSSGSTKVCVNQPVTLFVDSPFAAYQWNTGSTSASITVTQPGQYYAVVTDQNGCIDTSNSITVSNITPPTVQVFPDTLILFGDSVVLYTDYNLASVSVDSFLWYPLVHLSCTDCANPVASPENDQYYGLTVYTGGCSVSDSALIRVILPNNFYIPNAFTPNGDGNNDDFYVLSQSGVRVILFQVFNRIGEKVHDGNYPWNGTYKGKPAPPGVYVYLFKLGLYGEDRGIFRKGSVTLIR